MRVCSLRQIVALVVLWVVARTAGAQMMGGSVGGVLGGPQGTRAAAAETPTVTIHVNGVVVSSVDGKPVARVLVSSMDQRYAALTDWDGRFSFDFRVPKPAVGTASAMGGQFAVLMLRKPGYVNANQPTAVAVPTDGSTTTNMQVKITPAAVIVGHVTADSGDLNSLRVILRRRQAQDGASQWVQAAAAQVDRNGEFRFPDLSPGEYLVMTSGWSRATMLGLQNRPDTVVGLLPTYYPGGSTLAAATPIHMHAGETVSANLRPQSATFYRISVGVDGVGEQNFGASLMSDAGYMLGANQRTRTVEGYLPSGSYTVRIESYAPEPQPGAEGGRRGRRQRNTWFGHLEVGSAPVVGRMIAAAPAGDVQVIVTRNFTEQQNLEPVAQVNPGGPTPTAPSVYVDLQPADGSSYAGAPDVEVQGDSVVLHNVPEGTYHVHITSPRGYVASAMSGSTNLLTTPLTVGTGGSAAPIYVTLRDDFASLACRVQGADANPQLTPTALVMGIPLDAPEMRMMPFAAFSQMVQVPSTKVPPGRYLVIAVPPERMQTLEYRNPEVMDELMSKGVTVTLSAGEKTEVDVPFMADGGE